MSKGPPPERPSEEVPLFLARQTYRRRRIMDAARLAPVLGLILFFFPVLWATGTAVSGTAEGLVYLFAVWSGLILLAALISSRLSAPLRDAEDDPEDRDGL